MAVGDQNYKAYLSFKDEATGKFTKATEDMVNSMKKLGINIKQEGNAVAVNLDKMGKNMEQGGRHARTMGAEIGKLAGTIGSMRNMLLVWMFALRPIIEIVKGSTEAIIQQEDAIKRINFAMGIQGTYSKSMSDNLIKLSQSFMAVTRYGDEAILEVMEKLITIGSIMPTQLERVTKATLDFSAATGKDLATSAEIMAKASQGITRGLNSIGFTVEKNLSAVMKFNLALEYIEKHMGGRAQADIKSYGGQIAQLKNSFGEVSEATGDWIFKLLNLKTVVPWLKDFFDTVSKRMTIPTTDLEKFQKQLWNINETLEILHVTKPRKIFGIELPGWLSEENDILRKREELKSKISKIGTENRIKKEMEDIQSGESKITQNRLAIQEQFEETYLSFQRTRASFRLTELEKEYATYKSAYADNVKELLEVDEWYAVQKAKLLKEGLKENEKDLIGNAKLWNDVAKTTAAGMRDAMADGFFSVITGEFENLSDIAANFGETVLKALMQALANKAMISIGLGSLLGLAHSGGYMLGAGSFTNVRKFHTGGMSNDESMAILKNREGVVNEKGMNSLGVDNLNRLNRGEGIGGGNVTNNYYINAIDAKSFRDMLSQNGDIYAGASEGAIRDNGSLRKTSLRWG